MKELIFNQEHSVLLKKPSNLILLTAMLFFIFVDLILNKYSFPLTEGWWETYSWLSDKHQLYKDYKLALPPLYIDIISILRNLVGENFYTLRTVFLTLKVGEMLGIYYLLKTTTKDTWSSIFGLLVAETLIVIFNPVYLLKDYHTLVSILVSYCICSYFYALKASGLNKILLLIASGIFTTGLILTKQNVALCLTLGIVLSNLYLLYHKKINFLSIAYYGLSITISIYLYSYFKDWLWLESYLQNDSKGSALTILTRFATDPSSINIYATSITLGLLITNYNTIHNLCDKKLNGALSRFKHEKTLQYLSFLSTFVFFRELAIPLALCWPIVRILLAIQRGRPLEFDFSLLIITYSLAFAGTMTAGYNFVSMEILIAICYAEIYQNFQIKRSWLHITLILIFAFIAFTLTKLTSNSYSWWGYNLSPISLATHETKFKDLNGIKLDKNTSLILDKAYDLNQNLTNDDTVFAYPNIPLIYKLLDKTPPVTYPVQWFDVFPSGKADTIINALIKNPPELIFWLRPTQAVYSGHAKLRKLPSGMIKIDEFLLNDIENKKYTIVFDHTFTDNFFDANSYINEMIDPVTVKYYCTQCNTNIIRKYTSEENIIDYSISNQHIIHSNHLESSVQDKAHSLAEIKFKNIIAMDNFQNELINSDFKRADGDLFRFLILKKNTPSVK